MTAQILNVRVLHQKSHLSREIIINSSIIIFFEGLTKARNEPGYHTTLLIMKWM